MGPNINAPMDDAAVPQAYAAVENAQGVVEQTTGKERALIQALAQRYSKEAIADRTSLDQGVCRKRCAVSGINIPRMPQSAVSSRNR